jgi:hypothetical protein
VRGSDRRADRADVVDARNIGAVMTVTTPGGVNGARSDRAGGRATGHADGHVQRVPSSGVVGVEGRPGPQRGGIVRNRCAHNGLQSASSSAGGTARSSVWPCPLPRTRPARARQHGGTAGFQPGRRNRLDSTAPVRGRARISLMV